MAQHNLPQWSITFEHFEAGRSFMFAPRGGILQNFLLSIGIDPALITLLADEVIHPMPTANYNNPATHTTTLYIVAGDASDVKKKIAVT